MSDVPITQKWLIGILTTILLGGGAAWMTSVQGDVNKLKDQGATRAVEVSGIKSDVKAIKDSQDRQERNQEKLDEKIQRLLDFERERWERKERR